MTFWCFLKLYPKITRFIQQQENVVQSVEGDEKIEKEASDLEGKLHVAKEESKELSKQLTASDAKCTLLQQEVCWDLISN